MKMTSRCTNDHSNRKMFKQSLARASRVVATMMRAHGPKRERGAGGGRPTSALAPASVPFVSVPIARRMRMALLRTNFDAGESAVSVGL